MNSDNSFRKDKNVGSSKKRYKKNQGNPYMMTAADILKLGITEIPTLINPIIPQKELTMLIGSSDTGKSYLCLSLARAICSKEDKILENLINRTHGSVIYVCTEDSTESICFRLSKMTTAAPFDENKLRFIFDTEQIENKIRAELHREPADLVIIDTLGDVFKKKLNESIEVRQFLNPFKKLCEQYNCTILFCHHIGKGKEHNLQPSKNDTLGSQALEAACRSVIMLKKLPDGKRSLTIVKGNNIPEQYKNKGKELYFHPSVGFTATGNEINYSDGHLRGNKKNELTPELISRVKELHSKLKSQEKVAAALKEEGINLNKNKVGKILQSHSITKPSKKSVMLREKKSAKSDGSKKEDSLTVSRDKNNGDDEAQNLSSHPIPREK